MKGRFDIGIYLYSTWCYQDSTFSDGIPEGKTPPSRQNARSVTRLPKQ